MNLADITNVETIQTFGNLSYKVTLIDGIISFVPDNSDNSDWQAVQDWLSQQPPKTTKKK